MGRGATGFLVACALWSGALVLAALETGRPEPVDDVGSLDAAPLDLPRPHDEALVESRRDLLEAALEAGAEPDDDDAPWLVDDVDLGWWDDLLDDDDDPEPPPPLDEDPGVGADLDEWLGSPGPPW